MHKILFSIGLVLSLLCSSALGAEPEETTIALVGGAVIAIRVATLEGACVLGVENEVGSIEAGKFADMIVLDANLFEIDPERIDVTQVLRTVVGGKSTVIDPSMAIKSRSRWHDGLKAPLAGIFNAHRVLS